MEEKTAFVRQKAYDNAIQKVRIEFGTLIGLEKEDEVFVLLKELPTMEMMQLNEAHEKGQTELLKFFREVLLGLLLTITFMKREKRK